MKTLARSALTVLAIPLAVGLLAPAGVLAQHEDEHASAGEEHGDEHAAAAAHGAADHHEPVWDYTRLAGQLVNFAIWLALLVYFVRTRAPGFLATRRASLVEGLEEARRMKEEAERKVEEYSARIDNLDAELDKMRAEMKQGGLSERDRIVKDAAARAEKMHDEAKFLVQQQIKTLREELTREAIEAAIGAAEKILREKAGADQERLATEYLGQLDRQLKSKEAQ